MTKRKAKRKNPAAVALGKLGAKARAKLLTPEQRSDIARRAVNERWRRVRARRAA
jgi:hypothetical protein